jgi:hypothetical protein
VFKDDIHLSCCIAQKSFTVLIFSRISSCFSISVTLGINPLFNGKFSKTDTWFFKYSYLKNIFWSRLLILNIASVDSTLAAYPLWPKSSSKDFSILSLNFLLYKPSYTDYFKLWICYFFLIYSILLISFYK